MLCDDIRELTERALWETENLIACIPDALWDKRYDGLPMWKYVYHTLYSMDRWYINPCDPSYHDPAFHTPTLASLNDSSEGEALTRAQIEGYFAAIREKLRCYLEELTDNMLTEVPPGCEFTRMRLILGQLRHWHRHMGLIYGFIVQDTGKWPFVLNQCGVIPDEPMPNFYP